MFCYIERIGSHWALEHNPLPLPAKNGPILNFASSRDSRADIEATADRWHALLGHPEQEALTHLQQNVMGAVVTAPATRLRAACEPCALSRAQRIISRCSEKSEPVSEPLARVAYDLIPLDMVYNGDKWVSYFRCYVSGMDFVYIHRKKSDAIDIIEAFLNMIETRYNLSVRFICTDREQTLGNKYTNIVALRGITTERSVPDTPEQNGVAERSGEVIIIKVRCLCIAANLPASLWPEIFKATAYLNNRMSKRSEG
jgi:hypothetical protein